MRRKKLSRRRIKNNFIKGLINSFYQYREGIIIGGIIGWIAAFIAIKNGINNLPELLTSSKAVLDSLFTRTTLIQTINAKFYTIMIIIGSMMGTIIDYFIQTVMKHPPRRRKRNKRLWRR